MAGTAPYQLFIDLIPPASAIGVAGTITVTTATSHGITPGAYVQIAGLTGAGTAFNTVAQVATVPSGTAFTYVSGTVAGTATVTTGVISYDLLNPQTNYSTGANRQGALVIELESVNLSSNGDGTGSTMSFSVLQEVTPAVGPWFELIPDNARIRLINKTTGSTPSSTSSDVLFLGVVAGITSRLTDSGQGSIADVDVGDANTILDRVAVFGKASSARRISAASRNSNVSTYTTTVDHGFVAGQVVKISGVLGGGTATPGFNVTGAVLSSPGARTFSIANTGANGTAPLSVTCTFGRDGTSNDYVKFTASGTANYPFVNNGDTVTIGNSLALTGPWTDTATVSLRLRRQTFSGSDVIRVSDSSFKVKLARPLTGYTWGAGTTKITTGGGIAIDANAQPGQVTNTIAGGLTETQAVTTLLGIVNQYKSADYPLQRVVSTSTTSGITGGTVAGSPSAIQFASCSLRAALDTVIENFSGYDLAERRYYVGLDGTLRYELVNAAAQPLYANAPLKITTDALGSPDTTTGQATINPYALSVTYDHDTTKNAQFTLPSATGGIPLTTVFAYTDIKDEDGATAFATRAGAPVFDEVVDFPGAASNQGAQITRAAGAYFIERHKQMLTISCQLRGAGTVAHNLYGFGGGYAQVSLGTISSANRTGSTVTIVTAAAHGLTTGNTVVISGITGASGTTMNGTFVITVTNTTTFTYTAAGTAGAGTVSAASGYGFTLVSRWAPGQFCEVVSSGLGISGLFRVEQVSLAFEPGSYLANYSLTLNRRNPSDLAALVANLKR